MKRPMLMHLKAHRCSPYRSYPKLAEHRIATQNLFLNPDAGFTGYRHVNEFVSGIHENLPVKF